jgi:hypothetical protein
VLLDTQAHIDFFCEEFSLAEDKFRRVWVGADEQIMRPRARFGTTTTSSSPSTAGFVSMKKGLVSSMKGRAVSSGGHGPRMVGRPG